MAAASALSAVEQPGQAANPLVLSSGPGRWVVAATVLGSGMAMLDATVVGIALQFARGHALPIFGLAEIPSPWIADKAFADSVKEVHEVLANLLVILALFHTAAALLHHWVFGDNTLRRMLPRQHTQI